MKKNTRKLILRSFIGILTLSFISIGALSIPLKNNNENISVSNRSKISRNNVSPRQITHGWQDNSNDSISNNYTVASGSTSNDATQKNDSIQQDEAYSSDENSVAKITSSNKIKRDQITKYWLREGQETNSNQTSINGTFEWVVKKSDLAKLIGVETESETTIQSIIYSPGGEQENESLFVLLHSSNSSENGSYLFQINWKYEKKITHNSAPLKAGAYRFVKKLSSTTKYNFGAVLNPSEQSMQFLYIPDLTLSQSSGTETEIKTCFISVANFENENGGSSSTLEEKKYKIKNNVFSSDSSQVKYKPFWTHSVSNAGKFIFIGYKKENYNKTDSGSKDIILIKLTNEFKESTSEIEFNTTTSQNMIYEFSLNQESGFEENNPFFIKWFQLDNKNINNSVNYRFLVSQKSNKYNYFDVNIKDVWSEKDQSNKVKIIENKESNKKPIIDIVSKYEDLSKKGYYFLDEDQKVYKANESLDDIELVIDIKNSIYNIGDVFSIQTSRFFRQVENERWFAHMQNSKFAQFKDYTLIGQWDVISSQDTYELPLGISLKSQSEIDPSIIFKRIYEGEYSEENKDNWSSDFQSFLDDSEGYKKFLNIHFQDPRLPSGMNPSIKMEAEFKSKENDSKKYNIEITFKQTLNQIKANGSIDTSKPKTVVLAKQTYQFNNEIGNLTFANSQINPFDVPTFIRNKLPSEITHDEVKNYLIKTDNISNEKITFVPNDAQGTLRVDVVVPYMWKGDENNSNLVFQERFSTSFDEKNGESFFAQNSLGVTAEITPIDSKYIEDSWNESTKTRLNAKYNAILPSSVSKKEILESFVIFGSAFSQESNYENGLISDKNDWTINVVPIDKEGYAKIDIIIPKVGNKTNLRISFDTPQVFAKNQTSNSSVYFIFKDNAEIKFDGTKSINQIKASDIQNKLITNGDGNASQIKTLEQFANFSDYYYASIRDGNTVIDAEANDALGTLKISVKVSKEGEKLPGFSSNKLEIIYSGFQKDTNIQAPSADSIELNDRLTNIEGISPLNVTPSQLLSTYKLVKSDTNNKVKAENIELIASSVSGTLRVIVTVENYYDGTNVYPFKSFAKTYDGFKKSKESIDMIVWKSSLELFNQNISYKTKSPSEMKATLSNLSNMDKLKELTKISTDLQNELNEKSIVNFILDANDQEGILNVNVILNIDGSTIVINNQFSGFIAKNQPTVVLAPDTSSNIELQKLKLKLPSEISIQDANILYEFKNAEAYSTEIVLKPDDAKGVLEIVATIKSKIENGTEIQIEKQTQRYESFQSYIPIGKGTNWGIVSAVPIVSAIILIIPIVLISVLSERKRMKKVASRLDRRLVEQYKITKKESKE